MVEAAGRKMTGAVDSWPVPSKTCSCLLEGLLLLLLPDMAAGAACLHETQLYSRSGRERGSRQSWAVLQQVCSGELCHADAAAWAAKLRSVTALLTLYA